VHGPGHTPTVVALALRAEYSAIWEPIIDEQSVAIKMTRY